MPQAESSLWRLPQAMCSTVLPFPINRSLRTRSFPDAGRDTQSKERYENDKIAFATFHSGHRSLDVVLARVSAGTESHPIRKRDRFAGSAPDPGSESQWHAHIHSRRVEDPPARSA